MLEISPALSVTWMLSKFSELFETKSMKIFDTQKARSL
uniref:Uncharacterized protein n=1 Tax=Rhizophora mucronata TaxID=61149 RepID=A0A2P2P5T2_RHIMU